MTPSKSKTIACRLTLTSYCRLHLLSGSHRNLQAVLGGRIGALPGRAVVAVRIVGAVEIDLVDARGAAIEVHESPGRVGFRSARQIGERDEQPVVGLGR